MATLAEMLRQGADKIINLPMEAQRFITNPQAFTQAITGKNPLPRETGFAAGVQGLPPQNTAQGGVLNPKTAPYTEGYESAEPIAIAAMAVPAYAQVLRAGAPKVADAIGNYMVKTGGIQPMFIGPESKMFDAKAAFDASKMLNKGVLADEVFKSTNTVKGLDDQFRQELSDVGSHVKGGPTFYDAVMNRMTALEKPIGQPMYTKDVFYHPKLFESYPQLADIQIEFIEKGNKAKASFNPTTNVIKINRDLSPEQARSSMLHELQHSIQEIEGFNKGADANKIIGASVKHYDDLMGEIGDLNQQMKKVAGTPEYDDLMNRRMSLTKKVLALGDPLEHGSKIYQRYGGEAEARLTQLRRDLAPEKAKQFYPFEQKAGNIYGLDINPAEAIIDTASVLEPINRRQMLTRLLVDKK